MNAYASELLDALHSMEDHSRTFRTWIRDSNNFGRHEQLKEAMEEWVFFSERTKKLVPKFWAEQEKLMGEAPIDMGALDEVML